MMPMRMIPLAPALALALTAVPAAAQDLGDLMTPDKVDAAAGDAAEKLAEAGKDKLLLADLIGAELKGPDDGTIGTIENLVATPSGALVAAVVSVDDERLAVPYRAVKVARSGDTVQAQISMSASDLKESETVKKLTEALPGGE